MSLPIKFRPILLIFIFGTVAIALASGALAYQANLIPASRLINPTNWSRFFSPPRARNR